MSHVPTLTFRPAVLSDASTIADFNSRLAMETEGRPLDPSTIGNGVRRALELSPEVRYFVAESAGRVVGQLMLTREWSDWRNGWMIWLQSVYVHADFRGCGVFRSLLDYAIQSVELSDSPVCVRLYVEHHNEAAKSCYRSLGFVDSGYLVMERPRAAQ
jgi:ribosomal protein S18 acetylase RimI-like enzyme